MDLQGIGSHSDAKMEEVSGEDNSSLEELQKKKLLAKANPKRKNTLAIFNVLTLVGTTVLERSEHGLPGDSATSVQGWHRGFYFEKRCAISWLPCHSNSLTL